MKNKYHVTGTYTISFDVDIIAEDEDEAIDMANDIYFQEAANNGIYADPIEDEEVQLNADGIIDDVNAELIEENVETDEDEDDEYDEEE